MPRYKLTFTKEGYIRYTSHLDMLRLFNRAFKRSGIKLEYSKGFNPHPRISFAQPLSLGYTSLGELLEFQTEESFETLVIAEKLGRELPRGIAVMECVKISETGKSLASRVTHAEYIIKISPESCGGEVSETTDATETKEAKEATEATETKDAADATETKDAKDAAKTYGTEELSDRAEDFMRMNEIKVNKKTKKRSGKKRNDGAKNSAGEVEINIRPMIEHLTINTDGNNIFMSTKIAAGSEHNLSPALLQKAFCEFAGLDVMPENIEIMRTELFLKT
ncbi:MAG: TIGR03936 family radical SAM-associated protein [Eubacteriales bacterium]|nr:TIGR03936 family radical SAM-associated protein [Eubacteriales bacterium]